MGKKRTYSSVDVEKFEIATVLPWLSGQCIVSVDVAKTKFYAGIADQTGQVLAIVRFEHPVQTRSFLGLLEALREAGHAPQLVMEPTGTYGDALRHQCHVRGLPVYMSAPKHTHDMAEVLDGVPSMHDAKAVVVLAKLHVIKPGTLWRPESEARRTVRTTFDRRELYAEPLQRHLNRLEGLLAKFWPGFDKLFDVHGHRSWMALLDQFPGPEQVTANPEQARQVLRAASRGQLNRDKIEAVVASARDCFGVPMQQGDSVQLRELVQEIRRLASEQDRIGDELTQVVDGDPAAARMAPVIGPAAAAAILAYLGAPAEYSSASALEKAAGLNLKERSSGKTAGQLKITKRGPGIVRRNLCLAVLRLIQSNDIVRAWYVKRKGFREDKKMKAVVAVMRKLIRAIWHISRNNVPFDATRLFDTRRLQPQAPTPIRPRPSFASIPNVAAAAAGAGA